MSFHLHNKSFQVCSVVPIFINQKTKAKSLCSLSVHSMVEQGTECKIVPPDCHFLPTSCSCCSAPKAELKPNRPLLLDRRGSKGTMLCFFPTPPKADGDASSQGGWESCSPSALEPGNLSLEAQLRGLSFSPRAQLWKGLKGHLIVCLCQGQWAHGQPPLTTCPWPWH